CVVITAGYQTIMALTDIVWIPVSVTYVFILAAEVLAGLLPIWALAEWLASRRKAIPAIGIYVVFVPVFAFVYRLTDNMTAGYWVAHFYGNDLPRYLSLADWLVASLVATIFVALFFRSRFSRASKPQDHF
ncbi:MAG TPA: hypothetical protein VG839_07550, partial [Asticcacaulis sp.]|nr:hypothetical protein [Asticcacaulis sp.]